MALPMGTPTARPILGHKWKKGRVWYKINEEDGSDTWIPEEQAHEEPLDDYAQHKTVRKSYPLRAKINSLKLGSPFTFLHVLVWMIFSKILATAGAPAHGDVILGTLFNCQKTRNKGLYSFSQIDFCKKGYNGDPKRFTAEVFSYHPQRKPGSWRIISAIRDFLAALIDT